MIVVFSDHTHLNFGYGCFTFIVFLMSYGCYCTVTLPHGAVGWSSVCDCGIFRSYSPVLVRQTQYCNAFLLSTYCSKGYCLSRNKIGLFVKENVHLLVHFLQTSSSYSECIKTLLDTLSSVSVESELIPCYAVKKPYILPIPRYYFHEN